MSLYGRKAIVSGTFAHIGFLRGAVNRGGVPLQGHYKSDKSDSFKLTVPKKDKIDRRLNLEMSFKGISIGCSTPLRKKPDLRSRLKEISEQGFDFILTSTLTKWAARKRIEREAPVLKKLLKKFSLELYIHLPSFTHLGSPYTLAREGSIKEIAKFLESYSKLNVEKAVIHLDGLGAPRDWGEETIKKQATNSLRRLQKVADDSDITLLLENGGSLISSSLEKISQISKKAKTKICLDTGHAIISGYNEKEICDFLKKNKDAVPDFHINDVLRENDHLPLGCGTINFEPILRCLREIGWKGGLCLEYSSYLTESRKRILDFLKDL